MSEHQHPPLDARIRAWVERAGGSYAQAARQIGLGGRNPLQTVRRWATGETLPSLDHLPLEILARLAAQLGYRSAGQLAEAVLMARAARTREPPS